MLISIARKYTNLLKKTRTRKLLKTQLSLFCKDIFINTAAFGLVILGQQIIVLPILAKHLDESTFANCIIFVTILNIFSLILGYDVGNTKLVLNYQYKILDIKGDFKRILLMSMPVCIMASFVASLFLAKDFKSKIILICTILLANVKNYIIAEYRQKKDFKKIYFQNLIYFIFICIGIPLFFITKLYLIPFLSAETASLVYSLRKSNFINETLKKTSEFNNSFLTYIKISSTSLISNLSSYLDRFLIYPILGPMAVNIYFSASVMSKIGALIVNPVSAVILAWLSNEGNSKRNKIVFYSFMFAIPVTLIFWVANIILSVFALRLLYSQYFNKALSIVIYVSLSSAFAYSGLLIKTIILRYGKITNLLLSYITYLVIFAALGILLSIKYKLLGFAIASCVAGFIQWVLLLFMLKHSSLTKA